MDACKKLMCLAFLMSRWMVGHWGQVSLAFGFSAALQSTEITSSSVRRVQDSFCILLLQTAEGHSPYILSLHVGNGACDCHLLIASKGVMMPKPAMLLPLRQQRGTPRTEAWCASLKCNTDSWHLECFLKAVRIRKIFSGRLRIW